MGISATISRYSGSLDGIGARTAMSYCSSSVFECGVEKRPSMSGSGVAESKSFVLWDALRVLE